MQIELIKTGRLVRRHPHQIHPQCVVAAFVVAVAYAVRLINVALFSILVVVVRWNYSFIVVVVVVVLVVVVYVVVVVFVASVASTP